MGRNFALLLGVSICATGCATADYSDVPIAVRERCSLKSKRSVSNAQAASLPSTTSVGAVGASIGNMVADGLLSKKAFKHCIARSGYPSNEN